MRLRTCNRFLAPLVLLLASCGTDPLNRVADSLSVSGLSYDLAGEGPWIVLIHGTNLDRRMWMHERAWLQNEFRVLSYDLRGQGRSEFPTETYSNHGDLIELLAELGAAKATLVGLSAGTQVALDVALAAPSLVDRLVLVSPSISGFAPQDRPPFLDDLMGFLRQGDIDRANEVLLASPIMSVPLERKDLVRDMVETNARLWSIPYTLVEQPASRVIEQLELIEIPTLVLVGENDLPAVIDQGAVIETRMPNARKVEIGGGGHLLNLTSPQPFKEALETFFDSAKL